MFNFKGSLEDEDDDMEVVTLSGSSVTDLVDGHQ